VENFNAATRGNSRNTRKIFRCCKPFRLLRFIPRAAAFYWPNWVAGICFAFYLGATVEDFEILRRIRHCLVSVWLLRWWRGWRKFFFDSGS